MPWWRMVTGIELDVAAGGCTWTCLSSSAGKRRQQIAAPLGFHDGSRYVNLLIFTVQAATRGPTLDFLVGGSGSEVSRDSH